MLIWQFSSIKDPSRHRESVANVFEINWSLVLTAACVRSSSIEELLFCQRDVRCSVAQRWSDGSSLLSVRFPWPVGSNFALSLEFPLAKKKSRAELCKNTISLYFISKFEKRKASNLIRFARKMFFAARRKKNHWDRSALKGNVLSMSETKWNQKLWNCVEKKRKETSWNQICVVSTFSSVVCDESRWEFLFDFGSLTTNFGVSSNFSLRR